MSFKKCSFCKILKNIDDFYKRTDKPHLLTSNCKKCLVFNARLARAVWHLKNRERRLKAAKERYKKDPSKALADWHKRRAIKTKACPNWLTKDHKKQINEFFTTAKDLRWLSNEPLHVDHIVPLKSKEVCGLHVPWNLQILPKTENLQKGARF